MTTGPLVLLGLTAIVLVVAAWLARRNALLTVQLSDSRKREAALHHMSRILSGTVAVQEIAQQATIDAIRVTQAVGAWFERAEGDLVEVIASAGHHTPPTGAIVPYHNSFTDVTRHPADSVVSLTNGVSERLLESYPRRQDGGSASVVVPITVEENTESAHAALVLLTNVVDRDLPPADAAHLRAIGDLMTAAMRRMVLVNREHDVRTSAEAAVRDRDQVLRVVSHDLRNPLHTIGMVAQLLLDRPLTDAERRQHLEIVGRTVTRMHRLVRDLLDVARVQAGHALTITVAPVDASELVRDTVDQFRDQAGNGGQRLTGIVGDGLRPLLADRDRLLQVLSNLVGNALKFTPEGGRVVVRAAAATDDTVLFSIADTGTGIPAESLPHLFEPFWQASGRATLGTGLGLSIARGIVEAHGGRIAVESAPGEGTTFTFTVPVARTDAGSTSGPTSAGAGWPLLAAG